MCLIFKCMLYILSMRLLFRKVALPAVAFARPVGYSGIRALQYGKGSVTVGIRAKVSTEPRWAS
jgi:hypothetical protein